MYWVKNLIAIATLTSVFDFVLLLGGEVLGGAVELPWLLPPLSIPHVLTHLPKLVEVLLHVVDRRVH